MSVTAIYTLQAKETKADELLALLEQARDLTLTVDGCEGFDVYQGKDDRNRFVMVERWASVDIHQAHFEKNAKGSGWLDGVEALMNAPFARPQDSYYLLR